MIKALHINILKMPLNTLLCVQWNYFCWDVELCQDKIKHTANQTKCDLC